MRHLTLSVLVLACLTRSATAQYYPYNPYPQQGYNPNYNGYPQQPFTPQNYYYPRPTPTPAPAPTYYQTQAYSAQNQPARPTLGPPIVTEPTPLAPTSLPDEPSPRRTSPGKKVMSLLMTSQPGVAPAPVESSPPITGTEIMDRAVAVEANPTMYTGRGFMAGVGLLMLRPTFGANSAVTTTVNRQLNANLSSTQTTSKEFQWNSTGVPRFWLGYMFDNSWGISANYWQYQTGPGSVVVNHPFDGAGVATAVSTAGSLPIVVGPAALAGTPPDTITIGADLHLQVADFELVRTGMFDRLLLKGTFGGRCVKLQQTYTAHLFNPGSPALNLNRIDRQQIEINSFTGAGPTLSGEAGYRLCGGFSLYGLSRFSLLFGNSTQDATHTFVQSPPTQTNIFAGINSRETVLPVGEVEMGLGWSTNWRKLRASLKTGFNAQMWWDAGSTSIPAGGTFPTTNAALVGGVTQTPPTSATHSNLGFIGWMTSIGFQY